MGDLAGAADYYVKMRPDLSSPKHFFEVGKRIVNLSLARRDYPMALVHVSKVLPHQVVEDEVQSRAYVAVVQGVASLCLEQYDNAVRAFLSVGSGAVGGASYAEVASPNDVAVFGGVLALATMERREMQASVLENANFRTYLELEPLLRKAISCYINGRYKYCLDILDTYKADLLLDIYMQKHVELLYSTIRNKCIVQFLIPYSVVTLELMNETFGRPGESIEDELAKMISRRELSARLNPIDRVCLSSLTLQPILSLSTAS